MAKPKDKKSLIQNITNRYRVTAREARDIVTAVSSVAASSSTGRLKKTGSNFVKQVKEVGTAATTGKKGTSSDMTKKNILKGEAYTYRKGTQRK
jgi:hypothetical protein